MKLIASFLALIFTTLSVSAQVIRTEPAFPTQFEDITVYFDASEGNGGLNDFEGKVYAHTGVITSASNNPTDWKYVQGQWGVSFPKTEMTPEGNNTYSLAFNVNEFYGIPDGEAVEQLAFVFRNENGTLTGRSEDGSDIYTSIYPPDEGLLLTVFSPSEDGAIVYNDDSLNVQFAVNNKSLITILDNEVEVFRDSSESNSFFIMEPSVGAHELIFQVTNETDTLILNRQYFVLEKDEATIDPPFNLPLGLSYHTDETFVFQLYAPGKEHVFLLCPANEYQVNLEFKLNKAADRATFWIELEKSLFENEGNTYQYLVDGELRVADPYSTIVLDPFNDDFVPMDVLEELPNYPSDRTSGIVTAFDMEVDDFPWTDTDTYEVPEQTNIVVYELLMRDFLEDKNYKSLLDTLDYLENLGVTAIELMPVNEFEGNQSWGYNCSFHMALDKYYGSRDQLKAVVNEAHARGIAVILDVVYNHVFSQSPLAQLYWDASKFEPREDNPWLNVTAKHPFNVGYDVNHESPATKVWVKQTLQYWMEEFHIDGFRLDLSKGFTQRNSGSNSDLMAQYDEGRIAILKDYADHVWSVNPEAYVILEHFAYNDEETELANYGMMLWGNLHFEFLKAVKEQASDLEWLDYKARGWNNAHAVGYMESHDEERLIVDMMNSGIPLESALEKVETASSIFYLVPGPKMLWQFGELGFDYSINWCTNGSVDGCRLDPKPVVWDYLQDEERSELKEVVSNILDLKKNYPTFSTSDYDFNDGNLYLKTIHFNHEEMDAVVMANFRGSSGNVNPKFQNSGVWYEYFTGDSLVVADTEEKIALIGGEYRIYTSKRITPRNGFTTFIKEDVQVNVTMSPNPIIAGGVLSINSDQPILRIDIIDQMGRVVDSVGSSSQLQIPSQFVKGTYYARIFSNTKVIIKKVVIN